LSPSPASDTVAIVSSTLLFYFFSASALRRDDAAHGVIAKSLADAVDYISDASDVLNFTFTSLTSRRRASEWTSAITSVEFDVRVVISDYDELTATNILPLFVEGLSLAVADLSLGHAMAVNSWKATRMNTTQLYSGYTNLTLSEQVDPSEIALDTIISSTQVSSIYTEDYVDCSGGACEYVVQYPTPAPTPSPSAKPTSAAPSFPPFPAPSSLTNSLAGGGGDEDGVNVALLVILIILSVVVPTVIAFIYRKSRQDKQPGSSLDPVGVIEVERSDTRPSSSSDSRPSSSDSGVQP
jgi:hypothetical protein